tara:strand:+ start:499 stop:2583 length:2085 start_codon:yes stop_codon:yes gene_type:complete
MEGIYLTWLISALAIGVLLMPVIKPPWANITVDGFVDFLRRYWLHLVLVLLIYNAKDFLDEVDRILMANTDGMLNMTPWIYTLEGDMVLWVQQTFQADWLTAFMTHFYVVGFMVICYVSIFYFAYFDDRYMADRISLTIVWVYTLAIPFYLFFNVHVTGNYIPEMKTLAYNYSPEINDWFSRIDPFTNGMPSLHIAFPFAVWLCLHRFDKDERWKTYRRIVLAFTLLTAFCIIYLGIHWFTDIIGGMIVAAVAVKIASVMSEPFWNIFDERTINARLVTVLTNPKRALNAAYGGLKKSASRFSKPTSKETGVLLTVILITVAGVVTWDLTHQSIPAGGVDAPVGVDAADGWMITLDSKEESSLLILHDLSDLNSQIEIVQPILDDNSTYSIQENHILMANETEMMLVDISNPSIPLFTKQVSNPQQIGFVSDEKIVILQEGVISYFDYEGNLSTGVQPLGTESVSIIETSGDKIAMVFEDSPDTVHIGYVDSEGLISTKINATANEIEDEILEDLDKIVDIENATITDISLYDEYLAAVVDVNATTRLVLLDTSSGDSFIVSDPKYGAFDPHMDYGILMFAAFQNIDPENASSEKYSDLEIMIHDLTTNLTTPLTADSIDQWAPKVLENHYVFQQSKGNGKSSVEVQPKEPALQTYSSNVLKIGVMLMIVLVFINVLQRQKESGSSHRDTVLES